MAPASGTTRVACRHLPDADNPGDTGGEATPVPIPNTEVKLSSAEDTERAAFRENRSSPGFLRYRDRYPLPDPTPIRSSPRGRFVSARLRLPGRCIAGARRGAQAV